MLSLYSMLLPVGRFFNLKMSSLLITTVAFPRSEAKGNSTSKDLSEASALADSINKAIKVTRWSLLFFSRVETVLYNSQKIHYDY